MKPTKRSLVDGESANGSVNIVSRSGGDVIRPTGEWSESVHELLKFLETSGFEFSPRFVGVDESLPQERLTYLDGEVALRPWPEALLSLSGIEQIASMLKQYHEVVEDFQPTIGRWHLLDREPSQDYIIRHGDIGPWNMVWDNGRLVGLIDWDFAEPGTVLEDVAQTAWHCIPLKPPKRVLEAGVQLEHQEERFEHFCRAYGVSSESVLETLPTIHNQELKRMRVHGARGIEPWASFLRRGDVDFILEDAEWLARQYRTA